jgi:hypothetical protein
MAVKLFSESDLIFSFEDELWEVLKYDEDHNYIEIKNKLSGTRAIDFLTFYNNTLVMFEVKGFRGYGTQKSVNDRLAEGMEVLTTEVAQKVRDTIAIIVGISRNTQVKNTIWERAANQILENKHLMVIAWIEEDLNTRAQKLRKKTEMSIRTEKLKIKLSWLTTAIFIDNVKERHFEFEGFKVVPEN